MSIGRLAAILFVLLGGSETFAGSRPSDRPNVLLIFADDAPARDFGCYGNRVVCTPSIDPLAEQGRRFTNLFTPSTTCVPIRTCLYTGLYPIRHGAHANWSACRSVLPAGDRNVRSRATFPGQA